MVKVKNFNENLEKNFSRLGMEVKRNAQKEEFKDKTIEEVLKYTLENYPLENHENYEVEEKENTAEKSEIFSLSGNQVNTAAFLPSYMSGQSEDVKIIVENLIDLVFKNGLEKALKEAKYYPPFIVDAFHDALIDKIIPELKKRGLID